MTPLFLAAGYSNCGSALIRGWLGACLLRHLRLWFVESFALELEALVELSEQLSLVRAEALQILGKRL